MERTEKKKVVIIGGGFAGIRTALDLYNNGSSYLEITLISAEEHFEYYPSMYRVVTGASPLKSAIPLSFIFGSTTVRVIHATVTQFDVVQRRAITADGDIYTADYMIMALGSQNNYFHIEGVEDISYNMKSIVETYRLRQHIQESFEKHRHAEVEEALVGLHFVIVGGGPAGVELAGELIGYARGLARSYGITESLVNVDIVERGPRLLPSMSEKISSRTEQRLRKLGVTIFLNRTMIKNDSWTVFMKDMEIGARTVIWTAGVSPRDLSQNISGCTYQKNGRIIVDEYLQPKGAHNFFVAGDIADTPYSGLAQTALYDGHHIARVIMADIHQKKRPLYVPHKNAFDIPVGPRWAILSIHGITLFGFFPWLLRFVIDFKFLISIVPIKYVVKVFCARPSNT